MQWTPELNLILRKTGCVHFCRNSFHIFISDSVHSNSFQSGKINFFVIVQGLNSRFIKSMHPLYACTFPAQNQVKRSVYICMFCFHLNHQHICG